MEASTKLNSFKCAIHPSEFVQRVCVNPDESNCLRCIKCILSDPNETKNHSIINLNDFIDKAVSHYQNVQVTYTAEESAPNEFVEFLSAEEDTIKRFTQHIEKEKTKVRDIFGSLLNEFMCLCKNKEKEVIETLDQQLNLFKLNYGYYKSKLHKYYGGNQQKDNEVVNKESIIGKINKCNNINEMEVIIKDIIDNMAQKSKSVQNHQAKRNEVKEKIGNLAFDLKDQSFRFPHFKLGDDVEGQEALNKFRNFTHSFMEDFSEVKGKLQELSFINSINFDSNLVKDPEDIELLKEWISPGKGYIRMKLLYRGSKDGFDVQTFHKLCDWNTPNGPAYKASNKAWLFSMDERKKYPIRKNMEHQAILLESNTGPSFGAGPDLSITLPNKVQPEDIIMQIDFPAGTSHLGVSYDQNGEEGPSGILGSQENKSNKSEYLDLSFLKKFTLPRCQQNSKGTYRFISPESSNMIMQMQNQRLFTGENSFSVQELEVFYICS